MLAHAIQQLPAGRYAVGASGGADSTALVRLLADRSDCQIILVHLDHGLRGHESDADAEFVKNLGRQFGLKTVIEKRSTIEQAIDHLPANPSSRYRAVRMELFRQVIATEALDGIVLAHHADDQAESVLLRLLRGGGLLSLGGMSLRRTIGGIALFRPLLHVHRQMLREHLGTIGQTWREDASNESEAYRRNNIRKILTADPELTGLLLKLSAASQRLHSWIQATAPVLSEKFPCEALKCPRFIAEPAARAWLISRGAPSDDVSPATCHRLILQAIDVHQPGRQHYPGGLLVRRRQRCIDVMPALPLQSARSHGKK